MPLAALLPLVGGAAGAATLGAAAIGAGASIYSSSQQASAAKDAAAGQAAASAQAGQLESDATTKAADLQQQQYDNTAKTLAPYQAAGNSALDQLTQELQTQPQYAQFNFKPLDTSAAAYQESPGLQTSLTRGIADLNSQYAAKGLIGSGAAAKAIADYATGTRMNDYNAWLGNTTNQYNQDRNFAYNDYTATNNRTTADRNTLLQSLYSIAGLGGQANGQLTSAGNNNVTAQSNLLTSNAANQTGLLTSNANNQGQAGVAVANDNAQGLNTGIGTLTSALNKFGTSYTAPAATGAASMTGNVNLGTGGMTMPKLSSSIF